MSSNPPIRLLPAEVAVFRAPPRFSTYDWARENLRVVSGPYKGKLWRPDVSPQAQDIMAAWDAEHVRKIFLIAPSQSTKTTIAYACLFASLARKLKTTGVCMPDEEGCRRIFDEKLTKYVRQNTALRGLLTQDRKSIHRTEVHWRDGSTLYGLWAGSESRMSSVSLQELLVDEEDAYADAVAVGTVEERVTAYEAMGTSKVFRFSKPRGMEDEGTIWHDAQAQAQAWMMREARCPSCGGYHVMDDRNIIAVGGERDPRVILQDKLARYRCPQCEYLWTDAARNRAQRDGRWVAGRFVDGQWQAGGVPERPEVVCYHLRSWESVLVSLNRVLSAWWEAQGEPRKMQLYDNNYRAVPYRTITRETPKARVRKLITEHLPNVAPAWTWVVTAAADHQLDGLWFVVRAWGKDRRSMLLRQGWLNSFAEFEQVLDTTWQVEDSAAVAPVWRAAIDIGGTSRRDADGDDLGVSMTDEVKIWLQENAWRGNVFGVKGAAKQMQTTIRPTSVGTVPGMSQRAQAMAGKMTIYLVDTHAIKDLVAARLNPASNQPMLMHAEIDGDGRPRPGLLDQYIAQLTSEKKRVERTRGGKAREVWDAGRRANHLLDCEVYGAALVDPWWTPSLQMLADPWLIWPQVSQPKRSVKTSNPYTGR